ncbi:uncharacterized protein BT62DRAFT_889725 [Guyanagaster necrorhizus]|uniref:Methyltransferase domain-containing protein n=1 Tax=Guyanagaster necrorhizus TaxID=856835 RepID=A0A9P7VXV0_9AGAR|nr:uncharacterized protein BT62DRAFT_889725 [Guyanagaster necrorhizus MCA 3950]KAG7448598.1 hypothetical protein BT62DRAFT_889725 [Guyanagaster necrorhizus MCA 3950]
MSLPLRPELYSLSGDEAAFFKSETGIEDDDELKSHILTVQAEAYKIRPYPCIRIFSFMRLKISRHPSYQRFLAIGRKRKDAIYAEIGCCFGNDVRKAVVDGFPVNQIIATDLHPEFWTLGHRLFKSTPDSFPARFIAADVFQCLSADNTPVNTPISEIQSLGQLRGHISAIHTAAVFHLFNEEQQLQLGKIMAILLSSTPGSMIFGTHIGLPTKGHREEPVALGGRTHCMFCHSPETWRSLWDGGIFPKGAVDVEVSLKELDRPDLAGAKFYMLVWCITVL